MENAATRCSENKSANNLFYNCPALTGFTVDDALLMTVKELIENAVDACRDSAQSHRSKRIMAEPIKKVEIKIMDVNEEPFAGDLIIPLNTLRVEIKDTGCGIAENTIEHLGTLFGSSKRNQCNDGAMNEEKGANALRNGKFGLGLKMVLINSAKQSGVTKMDFRLRVSSLVVWTFVLNFDSVNQEIRLKNHQRHNCSLTEDSWVTQIGINVPSPCIFDDRIKGYLVSTALLNPEMHFTLSYLSRDYHSDNSNDPVRYDINYKWSSDDLTKLSSSLDLNIAENNNIKDLQHLSTPPAESLISCFHYFCKFNIQPVKLLSSSFSQYKSNQTTVTSIIILCRDDSKCDNTSEEIQSSDETNVSGQAKLWCWKSTHRMPLMPSDSSNCLITRSFFSNRGQFGLIHLSPPIDVSQIPSWLSNKKGVDENDQYSNGFPNSKDVTSSHNKNISIHENSFYKIFKLSTSSLLTRSPFANYTDMFMFINVDSPELDFGTLAKSHVKGPAHLKTSIHRCLVQTFLQLQEQCIEKHQLEDMKDAQFRRSVNLYGPKIAKSLTAIIMQSKNKKFQEESWKLLGVKDESNSEDGNEVSQIINMGNEEKINLCKEWNHSTTEQQTPISKEIRATAVCERISELIRNKLTQEKQNEGNKHTGRDRRDDACEGRKKKKTHNDKDQNDKEFDCVLQQWLEANHG